MENHLNLSQRREELVGIAAGWYELFKKMSEEKYPQDNERTGIQVSIWEQGTRNLAYFSISQPSEAAQLFSAEKMFRASYLGDFSSANSANAKVVRFPGCLGVRIDGVTIFVSVSGLRSEVDAAISVMLISYLFLISPAEVCRQIGARFGELPDEFSDKQHFLYEFVSSPEKMYSIHFRTLEEIAKNDVFNKNYGK